MKLARTICKLAHSRVGMLALSIAFASSVAPTLADDGIDKSIAAVHSIGLEGEGFEDATTAARDLQKLPAEAVLRILDGADSANPIAKNWFRGIVFGISKNSGNASLDSLTAYVQDKSRNPIGRGIAMELIRKQDPSVAKKLIDSCLNDDSLALREMAVEQKIEAAQTIEKTEPGNAIAIFRSALAAARHPRQLSRIVEALTKLGDPATTASAFSLITDWQTLAPFDNAGGVGFDAVYAPERGFTEAGKIDLELSAEGKSGSVSWQSIEGTEDDGVVDLSAAFNKEKGAVAYVYTEFQSPSDQPAQARLGCINANKLWVNGKEVMSNEVYHSGSMLDQYTAPVQLLEGTNKILLKICQNEQEEPWAQKWEFQFRLTDPTGKGLLSGE